jgi:hypothetical protein
VLPAEHHPLVVEGEAVAPQGRLSSAQPSLQLQRLSDSIHEDGLLALRELVRAEEAHPRQQQALAARHATAEWEWVGRMTECAGEWVDG